MNYPDPIKIDDKVSTGAFLEVSFEKDSVPIHAVKLHEALRRRDIDQFGLYSRVEKI